MAGSGTAIWSPNRPQQVVPAGGGPRFVEREHRHARTGGRATRRFRFGSDDRIDPDPPLAAGSIVGDRYRIVRLLGEGGMGRVYEAEHTVLRRRVALKLLRRDAAAEAAAKEESLARFRQEALAASRIGTPQIVEVVDFASHVGAGGEQTYMVMELLAGESLELWMDRNARLDQGLAIVAELCEGLAAAHRADVVHRDIKPANVFLPAADRERSDWPGVKILDFGIAKITAGVAGAEGFQTRQGSLLGTPYYLAPERIMGAELTGAADLYSVGVILYEMLTGVVPFVADSFMGILANHVHTSALDPRQAAPDRPIPAAVAQICMSLLSKDPRARPSAEALCSELRALLARDGAAIAAVEIGPRSSDLGGDAEVVPEPVEQRPTLPPLSERPTLPPVGEAPIEAQRARVAIAVNHHDRAQVVAQPKRGAVIGLGVLGVLSLAAVVAAGASWLSRSGPEPAAPEPSLAQQPSEAALVAEPPATLDMPTTIAATREPPSDAPSEAVLAPTPEREVREPQPTSAAKPKPESKPKPVVDPKPSPEPEPKPVVAPPEPAPPPPKPEANPELPTIKDDVYD